MAKKRRRDSRTGQSTRQGFISTKLEPTDVPDYVVVELRYESPIAATASGFVAPEAANRRQAGEENVAPGQEKANTVKPKDGDVGDLRRDR